MVRGFATDSREVHPGDAFLAIVGARTDGHDHVPTALGLGASLSVVERRVNGPHILVPNLVAALAIMALSFRESFSGAVIGVTGSAGKTTTKEFLRAALASQGQVLATTGNRNTEFTAPLLWAELTAETHAVVVEMAMRGLGQISHLTSFSRPTMGVITNIGYSHLLQVGSRAGIVQAKTELFDALPEDGVAVYPADDDFATVLSERAGFRASFSFGIHPDADCRISDYYPLGFDACEVKGICLDEEFRVRLAVAGRHMALNAAAAILVAMLVGIKPQDAADQLRTVALPPMRMEVRRINGATILLDTYNAGPPSMIAALETLSDQTVTGRRRAVIGEMKELGEETESAHRRVAQEIIRQGIVDVILVGDTVSLYVDQLRSDASQKMNVSVAQSMEDVHAFLLQNQPGDVVLIKGSRALELERALEGLEAHG